MSTIKPYVSMIAYWVNSWILLSFMYWRIFPIVFKIDERPSCHTFQSQLANNGCVIYGSTSSTARFCFRLATTRLGSFRPLTISTTHISEQVPEYRTKREIEWYCLNIQEINGESKRD